MSLYFSLAAWEVKGSGAVWISDAHHRALMEAADAAGLTLLLRMRNANADTAYASYELGGLAAEVETLRERVDASGAGAEAEATLLPSAGDVRELLAQLGGAIRRAQEWDTDILVRSEDTQRWPRP
jgi:hypothetical protein